jgi:hypothetical protein
MKEFFFMALDWSEVWALLFPIGAYLMRRNQPATMKPVIVYLWLALLINLAIDIIMGLTMYWQEQKVSNNPLYNLHSVVRFACFSVYFINLPRVSFKSFMKVLAAASLVFFVVNFVFFENFLNPDYFSGNLLALEAYLLLVYCMLYYLNELKDDRKNLFDGPDFWVVTGLCIYVVVNFFVFLFYLPMINVDVELAINIWNVHNIAFIIFCFFLTKAIYGSFRYQYSV